MIGSRIGPYQIVRLLGEPGTATGTGMVYEAVNSEIDRRVVIKVLSAEMAHNAEAVRRFFNEARAVNRISHPGVVQTSEFGKLPTGGAYFVMEYLDGETLASRLNRHNGRLPELDVLRLGRQLASALTATHEKGIVHRDLKPGNVMLLVDTEMEGGKRVKLLGFGVAKLLVPLPLPGDLLGAPGSSGAVAPVDDELRTREGVLLGTPVYMSPEQCRGDQHLDGKSDVYTLAVLMYQMLAGQPPFVHREGGPAVMAMHLVEPVPALLGRAPGPTPALVELIEHMLAKSPAERPTMRAVATALAELIEAEAHRGSASSSAATRAAVGSRLVISFSGQRRDLLLAGGMLAVIIVGTLFLMQRCASSPPPVAPVGPAATLPADAALTEGPAPARTPEPVPTPVPTPIVPVAAAPPTPPSPVPLSASAPNRPARTPSRVTKRPHKVRSSVGVKAVKSDKRRPIRLIN